MGRAADKAMRALSQLYQGAPVRTTAVAQFIRQSRAQAYRCIALAVADGRARRTGLLLGYARIKSKSIAVPFAMHAFMNLVATVETAVFLKFFA